MEKQNEQNNSNVKKQHGRLAAVVGLLFVAICLTCALLASRLKERASADEGVIALVPENSVSIVESIFVSEETSEEVQVESITSEEAEATSEVQDDFQETTEMKQSENDKVVVSQNTQQIQQTQQTTILYEEVEVKDPLHPAFEVSDGTQVWGTTTEVQLFKINYENGDASVTVDGTGDNVIAPGTGNSYTFCLKNTGDTSLDYTLSLNAFFTSEQYSIPVEVKVKGFDGTYLLGTEDSWADVLELNNIEDKAHLKENRYAYYTLEWQWPFENGTDEYDTLLGNAAVNEDVTLTISINTIATGADMTTQIIQVPRPSVVTGDSSMLSVWIALTGGAALLLVILFIKRKKTEDQDSSHEEK